MRNYFWRVTEKRTGENRGECVSENSAKFSTLSDFERRINKSGLHAGKEERGSKPLTLQGEGKKLKND